MSFKISDTKQAAKVQASQRSKAAMGKKNLELGKEYTILFPKKDNRVVVSGIVGRNCNYDALKVSFGRIADSQMEVNPETGRIKDLSGMRQWATLSGILYKAAKLKDIQVARDEAQKIADATSSAIDEVGLQMSIDKVELAYEGAKATAEAKAILPTKQRLISYSVDFSIFTEAVLIPLNKQLQPEFDKAAPVEVRLSKSKIDQINSILDNPMYNNMDDPDGFLEIKFSYVGESTKAAGQNKYTGCEAAVRKVNLTKDADGNYVDSGTLQISGYLKDTTHDPDIMFSRAGTVSFANTAQDVEAAMRKYLSNNRTLPLFIDLEDEATKRAAKDIIALNCVFGTNTRQYTELMNIIEEQEAANGVADDDQGDISGDVGKLSSAKDTQDVAAAVAGNEELSGMISQGGVEDI